MKSFPVFVLLAVVGLAITLVGCSKDPIVGPPSVQSPDQQALQQQATDMTDQTYGVAQFSSSDESTVDDNGLRDPDFEGVAKIDVNDFAGILSTSADSIYPVRWGRHIFWNQVTRTYTVVVNPGDSSALVTITKSLPGEFWVGLGTKTVDTVIVDSIIKKPFREVVKRKVRFIRVARTDNPLRNWRPVAITMVLGQTKPDSLNQFSISSMEFEVLGQPATPAYTDPLNTWFRLGLFHGTVPELHVGDSVKVTLTVNSSEDSAEIAHLRYGIAGDDGERRRTKMRLVSNSGGVRVYERTFVARLPRLMPSGILAARFNAIVDVFSYGSIYVNDAPFTNEYWGFPYIVVR
jgi:hypothetical protein